MNIQVFDVKPPNFSPQVEVAGCYCFHQNRLLLLERRPTKPQGGTWGIPCGKLERDETPVQAVIREIKEEVGIDLIRPQYVGALYMILDKFPYVYHAFKCDVPDTITLNLDEHLSHKWVTFEEAYKLPLIGGGREALEWFVKFS